MTKALVDWKKASKIFKGTLHTKIINIYVFYSYGVWRHTVDFCILEDTFKIDSHESQFSLVSRAGADVQMLQSLTRWSQDFPPVPALFGACPTPLSPHIWCLS